MLRIRTEDLAALVRPLDEREIARARADLESLAHPRLTGSDGARHVDRLLRKRFSRLGYEIRELPFEFSGWVGRFGAPAAGGVLLAGVLTGMTLLFADLPLGSVIALGATTLLLACMTLFALPAVRALPWGRETGVNWLVARPGVRPRFIVAAHRDTKSQPVSTYVRAGAVLGGAGALLLLLLLAVLYLFVPFVLWTPLIAIIGAVAVAAAIVLLACSAGNDSPGALDNASGLAALLGVAERMSKDATVAFLLTDAEELGLAGAQAVAPELPRVEGLINLDGLDDEGPFHLIERHGWLRPKGIAPNLAAPLLAAADRLHLSVVRRNLPAGLLVDSVAFVRAKLPAVTLMRGTTDSLRRVHRPADSASRIRGDGVIATIALLDGALAVLRSPAPPHEPVLPEGLRRGRDAARGR